MRNELHYDAVVIGAGTAGLVAGLCGLARGNGSPHLAPATIDVLGYAGGPVSEPGRALEELIARRPDHPYARIGRQTVEAAVQWLSGIIADGPLPGYRYVGDMTRSHR